MVLLVAYTKKLSLVAHFVFLDLQTKQPRGVWRCKGTPACGIHVFRTPLLPSEIFFLGKPAWILELDVWIQKFTTRSHKLLDSTVGFIPIATWNDQFGRRLHMWNHVLLFKSVTVLASTNHWPRKNPFERWRLMPVLTVTCLLFTFHWRLIAKRN